jgi:hypothetical protein
MQPVLNERKSLPTAFKSFANLPKFQNNPKSNTNYQITWIYWFINQNLK